MLSRIAHCELPLGTPPFCWVTCGHVGNDSETQKGLIGKEPHSE